jgi:hypothetical protein
MSDAITTTFSITLSMDDLAALLARSMGRGTEAPPLIAVAEMAPLATGHPETAANQPAPRSARATRAAREVNGRASPAQEPAAVAAANPAPAPAPAPVLAPTLQIPPEEELRPLLSKMAAVHHDKVKGVTDMLKAVGGFARLVECPPDTWPAIKQACDDAIAAAGG